MDGYFTLHQARELIGEGATYRTVRYYKDKYPNDVFIFDTRIFVSQSFIDKVKRNRALNSKVEDKRTRSELFEVIAELEESIKELKKGKPIEVLLEPKEIESLKSRIEELESLVAEQEEEMYDRSVRIGNFIKTIEEQRDTIEELQGLVAEYEDSEIFEKAGEGFRVETFSQEEFDLFSERLIQWRLQRQEIESTKVHFESLKDERDFIKGQLDYFKSSNDKILLQHQQLIEVIGQRNRIEAVEKGAIKKEPREI